MRVEEVSIEKSVRIYSHFRALRIMTGSAGPLAMACAIVLLLSLPFGIFLEPMPLHPVLVVVWLLMTVLAVVITFLSMLVSLLHKHLLGLISLSFGVVGVVWLAVLFVLQILFRISMTPPGAMALNPGLAALILAWVVPHFILSLYLTRLGWSLMSSPREVFAVGRGPAPRFSSIPNMFAWGGGVPLYVSRQKGKWKLTGILIVAMVLSIAPFYAFYQTMNFLSNVFRGVRGECSPVNLDLAIMASQDVQKFLISPVIPDTFCLRVTMDWIALAAVGVCIAIAFFWYVLRPLAPRLTAAARAQMRQSYDDARKSDPRKPILFLRAFADDHRSLPRDPVSTLERICSIVGEPRNQDEIVLDAATPYGPVVAIGDPDDPIPPFGAARVMAGDRDWKDIVLDIMTESEAIIISIDESPGLAWEIESIAANNFQDKTLFLFGPDLDAQTRRDGASMLARLLGERGYAPDLPEKHEIVGAYVSGQGALVVLTAKRTGVSACITACRWFLLDKFGHARNSMPVPKLRPGFVAESFTG